MTTERIAAAIKPILDEDRRADRERIAELERDAAILKRNLTHACASVDDFNDLVADMNKQLDELTEKCAALVVENKRLREDDEPERKPLDVAAMNRVLDECGVTKPERYDNSTLRIDPDMSDPQPGKLLVVRLDASDVDHMKADTHPTVTLGFFRRQLIGFLVETPAVEVKRTPKVGDRVRFAADSNHPGIMGVVSHDLGDGAMLVSQGESASHNRPNFVAMPTEIEVIE